MKLSNYPIIQLSNYKSGVTKFISLSSFTFAILLSCYLAILPVSLAQEESTSAAETAATPTPKEDQLEKIRKLKERVATKVAELRKKSKKAYSGEIKDVSESTILLLTKKEDEITIKVGEETKIFRVGVGKRKEITIKNLETGEKISALGVSEEELPAKIIIVKTLPLIIHGKVTEVDAEGGIITIQTKRREEFVVDYEKTTKCKVFEKGKGLVKGGLSKIKIDDRIHIIGTQNENDETRLTARRILVLPGKALGIVGKEKSTLTPTITPSPAETD